MRSFSFLLLIKELIKYYACLGITVRLTLRRRCIKSCSQTPTPDCLLRSIVPPSVRKYPIPDKPEPKRLKALGSRRMTLDFGL